MGPVIFQEQSVTSMIEAQFQVPRFSLEPVEL